MQKTHHLHPSRMPKPPRRSHPVDGSGELDVFEATRYFSGGIDGDVRRTARNQREERASWSAGRRSLDTLKAKLPCQSKKVNDQNSVAAAKEIKKSSTKQPNSPGGKLASFLDSLFKQAIYKKRYMEEEREEAPPHEERRRRSSISTRGACGGGSSECGRKKPAHFCSPSEANWYGKREEDWPVQLRAKSVDGCAEDRFDQSEMSWSSKDLAEKEERDHDELLSGKYEEEEDDEGDAESDSSSDLFELKSFDLAGEVPSFDLPIYGSPILQL